MAIPQGVILTVCVIAIGQCLRTHCRCTLSSHRPAGSIGTMANWADTVQSFDTSGMTDVRLIEALPLSSRRIRLES